MTGKSLGSMTVVWSKSGWSGRRPFPSRRCWGVRKGNVAASRACARGTGGVQEGFRRGSETGT
eukprot:2863669-Pyramimonas_sp.AAC.2